MSMTWNTPKDGENFCNKYFATVITLVCGYILTQIITQDLAAVYSANQLLLLCLITLCVFFTRHRPRKPHAAGSAGCYAVGVTFTALVERCIALVKATMLEPLSLW